MGERPCLRALEAHGDMIRSVLLGREMGDSGGAFIFFFMAFMGVSTSSWYVKAEKNECARGGTMCVNRVKSVSRVAAFGGHDWKGEQVLHIGTATSTNALFSRTKIHSLRINTFL